MGAAVAKRDGVANRILRACRGIRFLRQGLPPLVFVFRLVRIE